MTFERPVPMANQVAAFCSCCPEAEAIDGTASYLQSFRDPRRRRDIEAHLAGAAGAGLSHIALEAVKRIARMGAAQKSA